MQEHDVTATRPPRALELATALRAALVELYPSRPAADYARVAIRLADKAHKRLLALIAAAERAERSAGPVGAARVASRTGAEARMAEARDCYALAELQQRNEVLNEELAVVSRELHEARKAALEAAMLAHGFREDWLRERERSADLAAMLAGELAS